MSLFFHTVGFLTTVCNAGGGYDHPLLTIYLSTHAVAVTVRETLTFRVELKLGSQLNKKSRADLVEDLITQMRLEKAADTIVGDSKVRGISGGERRRLAIACELISSPSVIFLDEPTTGKILPSNVI